MTIYDQARAIVKDEFKHFPNCLDDFSGMIDAFEYEDESEPESPRHLIAYIIQWDILQVRDDNFDNGYGEETIEQRDLAKLRRWLKDNPECVTNRP